MSHLRVDDEDSRVWHVNRTVADRVRSLIPETGVKRLWCKQLLNVHQALDLELLGAALDHLPATVAFWNEAGSTKVELMGFGGEDGSCFSGGFGREDRGDQNLLRDLNRPSGDVMTGPSGR